MNKRSFTLQYNTCCSQLGKNYNILLVPESRALSQRKSDSWRHQMKDSWEYHIDNLISKLNSRIYLLKRARFYLNFKYSHSLMTCSVEICMVMLVGCDNFHFTRYGRESGFQPNVSIDFYRRWMELSTDMEKS